MLKLRCPFASRLAPTGIAVFLVGASLLAKAASTATHI
jgi:hypothetical protein